MNLELLVKSASRLFTLPEICIKIHDLIHDPSSSMTDIAKLISIDPSLSARLLKIANSSFYSFSSQIDSLDRAINIIGTADIYNLALATSTPSAFDSLNNNEHIDIKSYWRHSVMTGLIARGLAQTEKIRHPESLFLAGLFHNLGQLVVLEQMPEIFLKVEEKKSEGAAPWEIEKEVLDYTYADISCELLKCWKMPESIISIVSAQNNPSLSNDARVASYIHIATRAASQLEFGDKTEFDFNQAIDSSVWQVTNIDEESLRNAISLAEVNCYSMLAAMTGKQVQVA